MDSKIEGSFVALVTPFNRDGSVDLGAFRTLIDFQVDNGTSAILILGSTGEPTLLTQEERHLVVRETAKMKRGDVLFFYGCTTGGTDATISNVKFAREHGADGAILAAPPYITGSEADIERFFLDVAEATDLPLGIYNNPPRVGTDLSADRVLRILAHPNYVVHKESTSRVSQVAQVLAAHPRAAIMCCDSPRLGLVVPTMALGGDGTANMTGNVAPREMALLSRPWKEMGQARAFRETYLALLPLLNFTYAAINPVPIKSLMKALGLPVGDLRRPLRAVDDATLARGLDAVRALRLHETYGYQMPASVGTVPPSLPADVAEADAGACVVPEPAPMRR